MTDKLRKSGLWPWRRSISFRHVATAVLCGLGIALSIGAFAFARDSERRRLSERFEAAAQDRISNIREQVKAHSLILESLRALYTCDPDQKITREAFRRFCTPLLARYPDIHALVWIPRVPHAQRQTYEASARADGLGTFEIREGRPPEPMVSAAQRPEYFPVYFVEPTKGNEAATGFDVASEPTRQEALGRARDSGQAQASAPVTLAHQTERRVGFLIFEPLYERNAPAETGLERREHVTGFIVGVFRAGKLVENSMASLVPAGVDMEFSDTTDASHPRAIYYHVSRASSRCPDAPRYAGVAAASGLVYRDDIVFSGRRWSVVCGATPAFLATHATRYPWAILAAGLGFTFLAGVYLVSTARYAERQRRDSAARKTAEQSFELERNKLKSILDSMADGVYIVNQSHDIEYVNPVIERDFGPVQGMKCFEYFHGRTSPCAWCQQDRVFTGQTVQWEWRHEKTRRTYDLFAAPLRNADGQISELVIFHDITDRKRSEEALRESEEVFRSLVENIGIGVSRISPQMEVLTLNRQMRRWFPDIDLSSRPICHQVFNRPPRDSICSYCPTCKTLADGKVHEAVTETPAGDGARNYRVVSSPIVDGKGKLVAVIEMVEDITDRIRAESAIRESEERYRSLVELSPDAILVHRVDGLVLYVNRAALKLFLATSENELTGHNILDLIPAERREHVADMFRRIFLGEDVTGDMDERIVRLNGQEMDIEALGNRITYRGQPAIQVVMRDVTDRRQAQEALRKSEERFKSLVESVTDYIYTVSIEDGQTPTTVHGPGCVSVTGYAAEEYAASPDVWFNMVPQEDRPAVLAHAQRLTSGQPCPPLEHRIVRKDGVVRWVRNTPVLMRGERGQFVGYEGLIQDITDYRKVQEQLLQAQKMEAVGQLAGGIAHDFRNQLTVIKGFAEMLLRRSLIAEGGHEHVAEILKAVDRSTALSNELLTFSRKQFLRPEVLKIDDLIAGMGKSLARLIGEDICLSIAPGAGDSRVKVDPAQLQHAIINLVLNARDSMPKGGKLTIETQTVALDDAYVSRHADTSPGPHVMVAVSDTGAGMDRQTLGRIFEPFFTTKPVGQGTGLGLPMVYGFVKQSGGTVVVYSEPGRGTTVKLLLPAVGQGECLDAPHGQGPADARRGSGRVLIVEDEEPIRKMVAQTLTEHGYTAYEAPGPEEAMKQLGQGPLAIDLLLTDVVMPVMDGVELARRVRATHPKVKVLYVSGYTGKALTQHGIDGSGMALLVKPFGAEALLGAVRDAIEGQGSR